MSMQTVISFQLDFIRHRFMGIVQQSAPLSVHDELLQSEIGVQFVLAYRRP